MDLESILRPVYWADERIARSYDKIQVNSYKFNILAKLMLYPGWMLSAVNGDYLNYAISFSASMANTFDIFYNMDGKESRLGEKLKNVYSLIRLPVMAAGVSYIGTGALKIAESLSEPSSLPLGIQQIMIGAGFISWGSAMYSRNPKLF
jgi:hypothetical protein